MARFDFPADVISQGRITIPKKYRELYNIDEGDVVNVFIDTQDGD